MKMVPLPLKYQWLTPNQPSRRFLGLRKIILAAAHQKIRCQVWPILGSFRISLAPISPIVLSISQSRLPYGTNALCSELIGHGHELGSFFRCWFLLLSQGHQCFVWDFLREFLILITFWWTCDPKLAGIIRTKDLWQLSWMARDSSRRSSIRKRPQGMGDCIWRVGCKVQFLATGNQEFQMRHSSQLLSIQRLFRTFCSSVQQSILRIWNFSIIFKHWWQGIQVIEEFIFPFPLQ